MRYERFLLIDDHHLFLAGAVAVLNTAYPAATCTTATSTRAALDALDRGERFDLISVDLQMPEANGIIFIKGVRARGITAPVLVLSGTLDAPGIAAATAAGASAFFSKENDPRALIEIIGRLLRGERLIDDPVKPVDPARRRASHRDQALLAAQLGISVRQREILALMADGLSNKEIAHTLAIAEPTVKTHLAGLFRTLGARNRTACVACARDVGLIG